MNVHRQKLNKDTTVSEQASIHMQNLHLVPELQQAGTAKNRRKPGGKEHKVEERWRQAAYMVAGKDD